MGLQIMRFGLALMLVFASVARGATIDLPLQGYYRVGRYMPVHVTAEGCQKLRVEGDGVMPLVIEARGNAIDAVFPLLIVSRPMALVVSDDQGRTQTFPLRVEELTANQRLVGTVGLRGLPPKFAGEGVIAIPLSESEPIRGAPIAWETLDAVVCDGRIPGANDNIYRPLLGSGVTFAVQAETAPDRDWPWRKDGTWQVLDRGGVGPTSGLASEAAYRASAGWRPGVPSVIRNLVLAAAVVMTILLLGATLLGRRWAIMAVIALSLIATAGIGIAASKQSIVRTVWGTVAIVDEPTVQIDMWSWHTAPRHAHANIDWLGNTRPILQSPEQIKRQHIELECFHNGFGRMLMARLGPHEVLPTLSKNVYVEKFQLSTDNATDSPLHGIVRDQYLRPGVRAVGQSTLDRGSDFSWQAVVLEATTP